MQTRPDFIPQALWESLPAVFLWIACVEAGKTAAELGIKPLS